MIGEVLDQLTKIDSVKKLSATIQRSATKIDSECTKLNSGARRLLDEALVALAGVRPTAPNPSADDVRPGAA